MKKSVYQIWGMAPFVGIKMRLQRLDQEPDESIPLNFTEEHLLNLPRTMLPARPVVCLDQVTQLMGSFTVEASRMVVSNYCFPHKSAN